jgi:hypothetical protein
MVMVPYERTGADIRGRRDEPQLNDSQGDGEEDYGEEVARGDDEYATSSRSSRQWKPGCSTQIARHPRW